MIISAIRNFNINSNYKYNKQTTQNNTGKALPCDSFVKTNVISFGAGYENIFPPVFFKKLMQEGIQCAYTGVKLIPKEDYNTLQKLGSLIHPINIEIEYLKGFEDYLYGFERNILKIIDQEQKTTNKKNIYRIFKSKKHNAETNLRKKQLKSLNRLLIESRALPQKDYEHLRAGILNYIKLITEPQANGMILEPASLMRILKKQTVPTKNLKINSEKLFRISRQKKIQRMHIL